MKKQLEQMRNYEFPGPQKLASSAHRSPTASELEALGVFTRDQTQAAKAQHQQQRQERQEALALQPGRILAEFGITSENELDEWRLNQKRQRKQQQEDSDNCDSDNSF